MHPWGTRLHDPDSLTRQFAKSSVRLMVTAVKIDIVTPTRNRLEFLKENIESVKHSRTYPLELEIQQIIHDCGSDDGTAEWLEQSEMLSIRSDGPVPPGRARNEALAKGDGDFIIPLDDDDLLLQRSIHHFVHGLTSENTTASWAVADFIRIDSEGRYLPGEDYHGWIFPTEKEMLQAIFSGNHYIQGNVCFRRALFQKVGGYAADLKTAEDLELYVRFILEAGLPKYIPTVSHLHRVHDRNISRNVDKDRYNEDMESIYRLHEQKLKERGVDLILIP